MTETVEIKKLKPSEKKIIAALVFKKPTDEGYVVVAKRDLVAETNLSKATVTVGLKGLKEAGLIKVYPRTDENCGRLASGYEVMLDRIKELELM